MMNTKTTNRYDQDRTGVPEYQPQAHIFIYENLAYVSDRRFVKDRISIGRSPRADVILDHQSIADIHALVHFEGRQAFLTNKFPNNGLRLNGRSIKLEMLQHEDVIDIGPFSLKIKMNSKPAMPAPAVDATYAVRLVNNYDSGEAVDQAVDRLARMLRADPKKIRPLVEKDYFVIKKNLAATEAARWKNALLKAGIAYDVQVENARVPKLTEDHRPAADGIQPVAQGNTAEVVPPSSRNAILSGKPLPMAAAGPLGEEDEDEDEIWEARFSLQQKLTLGAPDHGDRYMPAQLQVTKSIGSSVIDVGHLAGNKKYHIDTEAGRICLARYKPRTGASVYITSQMRGYVENARGRVTADLDEYKSEAFLFRKGSLLYRVPVPQKGAVVIDDGPCRYRVLLTRRLPSPKVAVAPTPPSFTWKHWAWSAGTHLFFLLCLAVYLYFQAAAPKPQVPHFVKIDPSLLHRLEALQAPKPPKVEPPPPKPEPVKVAEKLQPPKKKPVAKRRKPILNASKSRRNARRIAGRSSSRHPRAGGGYGKGNIKNRNINQTGLLSVLSSKSMGGPSEAIAAVTNLDAVPVPGASDKNFTVGGVKGSLGNGKIAVATGAMIQTKGSQKVLRSAGVRGKGEVAALERGSTGKRQVQAMVTAKMSRTVKIEGGMSREMVKQVIDQHLQEITYCYENALMSNPNILGRMVFEWKILMNGRVGEIRIVASSVNSHEIHDCIKSAIKSWQFPKPMGTEVVVSYPFVFDLVSF
jgi:outer membrane biosynthesis protein TonB